RTDIDSMIRSCSRMSSCEGSTTAPSTSTPSPKPPGKRQERKGWDAKRAGTSKAAVTRLRAATRGPRPLLMVYTRQSKSDFAPNGEPIGPSLNQQLDGVILRPEPQALRFEHFQDADRSGKEISQRPGYLAMMARLRSAMPGEG